MPAGSARLRSLDRPRCRRARGGRQARPPRGAETGAGALAGAPCDDDRSDAHGSRVYRRKRLLRSGAVQRVLITGADGFAGRHLRSALEDRGIETLASSADVRDAAAARRRGRGGAPRRGRAPRRHHLGGRRLEPRARGLGGQRDRDAQRRARRRRARARRAALVASSAEVYGRIGEDEGPSTEDRPVAPISPYGRSKAAAELACARDGPRRRRRAAVPAHRARPDRDVRHPVVRRADRAHRGRAGAADAQGRQPRRAARLLRTSAASSTPTLRLLELRGGPRVFNVATGTAHSMRVVLDRLLALATGEIAVEVDPSRLRPADIPLPRRVAPRDSRRRPGGGQPGRSTKHLRTCWTPRDEEYAPSE